MNILWTCARTGMYCVCPSQFYISLIFWPVYPTASLSLCTPSTGGLYTHVQLHAKACTCASVQMHMHARVHTHTHTHTPTQTHTYTSKPVCTKRASSSFKHNVLYKTPPLAERYTRNAKNKIHLCGFTMATVQRCLQVKCWQVYVLIHWQILSSPHWNGEANVRDKQKSLVFFFLYCWTGSFACLTRVSLVFLSVSKRIAAALRRRREEAEEGQCVRGCCRSRHL